MTSTDIPIPPAVVEAAARVIYQNWHRDSADLLPPWELLAEEYRTRWIDQATAALRAGLAAWPGMSHAHNEEGEIKDWAIWYALPWHRAEISNGIILPLTENSNAES